MGMLARRRQKPAPPLWLNELWPFVGQAFSLPDVCRRLKAALLLGLVGLVFGALGQEAKFSSTTNLVIVNVSVKDKSGKPLTGLKKDDFAILEDDKLQSIAVFEEQHLSNEPLPAPAIGVATPSTAPAPPTTSEPPISRYQDKRLIALLFDFSAMGVPEELRAQKAAIDFLEKNMTPSDLVEILTFSTQLKTVFEFSSDRAALIDTIKKFRAGEGAELAAQGTVPDPNDDSGSTLFTADETEFNIFNTDLKLIALETAARQLGAFPQKKALVYFSSGITQTGAENQAQLRATVNTAVRANVSFYPIDARGLIAGAPGGDVTTSGPKGSSLFSGAGQTSLRAGINSSQETLYTLAGDTGGKALFDTNDLTLGIRQVQKDIDSYYTLGYYSTNGSTNGRFRRIRVRLNGQAQAKLDYRNGYYAPKTWAKFTASDKERQLEEALATGDPVSDLPLAIEVDWFRLSRGNYFIPVSVKVPGSAIGLKSKGAGGMTDLDFIGQVRDNSGKVVSAVRDGMKVKMSEAGAAQLGQRHLQYDTGFTLPPGDYTLRFLARENQSGKMGTFESKFTIPDVNGQSKWARLSSVVWAGQREPISAAVGSADANKKAFANHPLVQDGQKLIPSVTRVFRSNQTLFVYFEVYDPAKDPASGSPSVAATLSLFQGDRKVFESSPVRTSTLLKHRPSVLAFQMQLPMARLASGQYLGQVNVVDEEGRRFAFARTNIVIAQ
jgi:VWFA-related protein